MTDTTDELRTALMMAENPFAIDKRTLERMRHDNIDRYDRGVMQIPKCTRIDVPWLNMFLMRETGEIFAGLGQRMVAITRHNSLDEPHMLSDGVALVRHAQSRILYLKGSKNLLTRMIDAAREGE